VNQAELSTALTDALRLHHSGQLEEAEAAYSQIFDARPDTPDALQLLGTLLGQPGRLEDARVSLERAIELQPSHADAHYNLGECLHRLGEHARACDAYRAALTARSAHTEAAIGLSGPCLLQAMRTKPLK
jgi:tetratricopeptide (TPR) repeat protein